jgi:hypothetical protein
VVAANGAQKIVFSRLSLTSETELTEIVENLIYKPRNIVFFSEDKIEEIFILKKFIFTFDQG